MNALNGLKKIYLEAAAGLERDHPNLQVSISCEDDSPHLDALNKRLVETQGEHPNFARQDLAFFQQHHDSPSSAVLVLRDRESAQSLPVAYSVLVLENPNEPPLWRENQLRRSPAGLLLGTAIDPVWRGRGLQRRLIDIRLKTLVQSGRDCAQTTVAPSNDHSLNNLMKAGFEVHEIKFLFGGHPRLILEKQLTTTSSPRARPSSPTIWAPAADLAGQKALLNQGLVGVSADCSAGATHIAYAAVN